MIYEWRCDKCETVTGVQRTVADRGTEPQVNCLTKGCGPKSGWTRILSVPHSDFETMYDKGILERVEKHF